jgi:hypothetical protein
LAARWPRHIAEAVEKQNIEEGSDNFTSIASSPVGPSMASIPPDPNAKMDANSTDLEAKPAGGEKKSITAESPITAMDLATNRGTPHTIRGVSIPKKPDPPGPEGESQKGFKYDFRENLLTLMRFCDRLLYVGVR